MMGDLNQKGLVKCPVVIGRHWRITGDETKTVAALVIEAQWFWYKVSASGHEMAQEVSNAWSLRVRRSCDLITDANDAAGVCPSALQNNFFVCRAHGPIVGSPSLLRKPCNGCFGVCLHVVLVRADRCAHAVRAESFAVRVFLSATRTAVDTLRLDDFGVQVVFDVH